MEVRKEEEENICALSFAEGEGSWVATSADFCLN